MKFLKGLFSSKGNLDLRESNPKPTPQQVNKDDDTPEKEVRTEKEINILMEIIKTTPSLPLTESEQEMRLMETMELCKPDSNYDYISPTANLGEYMEEVKDMLKAGESSQHGEDGS